MSPARILLTEAAGEIAYALAPMIASGMMLGSDQHIILHLHDTVPAEEVLDSLKYELIDASFPLLKGVVATTNIDEAATDINYAVMLSEFPPTKEMDRNGVVSRNVNIYTSHALALHRFAHQDCKIVVVGSLANTNALVLQRYAEKIKPQNITTLTRLDHNRAIVQITEKLKENNVSDNVKNVIIWGTHSPTFQYIDITHAIAGEKELAVSRLLAKDLPWLEKEFISNVQQRGAEITGPRQRSRGVSVAKHQSSALSVASAVCHHMRDWVQGTPKGNSSLSGLLGFVSRQDTFVSMGVYIDESSKWHSYGVPPGLFFSIPVTCCDGNWCLKELPIDEKLKKKLEPIVEHLTDEKKLTFSCIE